ncbi:hypothetical protein [Pontibacter rugosus]
MSLLCFIATAALYFGVPATIQVTDDNQEEVLQIERSVQRCIEKAHAQAERLDPKLGKTTIAFSELLKASDYPVFIYRSGQLVFWSNHSIIPQPDLPSSLRWPIAVENEYGRFIIVPHQIREYTVNVYVPLQIEYKLKSISLTPKLEDEVFKKVDVRLIIDSDAPLPHIRTHDGHFLFALDFDGAYASKGLVSVQLLLLVLGLLFYVLFSVLLSRKYILARAYSQGIVVLLALLIGMRLLLLFLNLPFAIGDIGLFDPKFYAASFWSPSVGDLFLNMLLLMVVAGSCLYLFIKNKAVSKIALLPQDKVQPLQVACMLIFFFLLLLLFQFYYNIYHNTPLILDVTRSLEFSKYKVMMYGIMLMHTVALCLFTYMLATVVSVLVPKEPIIRPYKLLFVVAGVLLMLTGWFVTELFTVVFVGVLFWVIIIFAAQHQNAVSLVYRTYLFFFWW